MAPDRAVLMVDALRRERAFAAFYDWQGGLAWLRFEDAGGAPAEAFADAAAEAAGLRAMIARHGGGHATLVRADAAVRAAAPAFQPLEKNLAVLSARVTAAFDPHGVFAGGRLAG
jgi:glycolate oxidase FAD binding subunit